MSQTIKTNHGFTLIELVIVIVIATILYSISGPQFARYNSNRNLQYDAGTIEDVLQVAKSYAITKRARARFEINPGTNEFYYLEAPKGTSGFNPSLHQDKIYHLSQGVRVVNDSDSAVTFLSNGALIEGSRDPAYIHLSNTYNKDKFISINKRTGKVTVAKEI